MMMARFPLALCARLRQKPLLWPTRVTSWHHFRFIATQQPTLLSSSSSSATAAAVAEPASLAVDLDLLPRCPVPRTFHQLPMTFEPIAVPIPNDLPRPIPMAWELDQSVTISMGAHGIESIEPQTFVHHFQTTCTRLPDNKALEYKIPGDSQWYVVSYAQYYANCFRFAKALTSIGLQPHQCVNILGFNSPEWFYANNGTILAGGVSAGIYTTNGPEACKYISSHCKACCVVVENRVHLAKYMEIAGSLLPHLKAIVMWQDKVLPEDSACPVPVYSFEEFLQLGDQVEDTVVEQRMQQQQPGDCCTLIYTSGTTGPPKAVMISHDNFSWTAANVIKMLGVTPQERTVSFLPLSHVAAQLIDIHVQIQLGSSVSFAAPDALKGSLVTTLREVRPTFFFGVPRVWEKIMEKMKEVGAQTTGLKRIIANWAKAKGLENSQRLQYNPQGYGHASLGYRLANALVLSKIKAALGLDQCRLTCVGSAPMAMDVLHFFAALDIPVYEVYGQSECMGPHSMDSPGKWKLGTVGLPLYGTQTRVDPETGEIQYKGRHVFMGYLHDEQATRTTLRDGWLHSEDVGSLDEDGFLAVTGRIKELIITAGGENIPPVLIEDSLKAELPAISSAMVIGDRRKYLTFLCTLRCRMDAEGRPLQELDPLALRIGASIGSDARTITEARSCDKWNKYISDGMQRVNAKATSRAQKVQKFTILPQDFSIPGGELTPTLKLKRAIVLKEYAELIDQMYEEPSAASAP